MLVSNNYKITCSLLFLITFTNSKTPDDEVQSLKVNNIKSEWIAFVERIKTALPKEEEKKERKKTCVFPSFYLMTERSPDSKTLCFFCDSLSTRRATEFGSLIVVELKQILISADHRKWEQNWVLRLKYQNREKWHCEINFF